MNEISSRSSRKTFYHLSIWRREWLEWPESRNEWEKLRRWTEIHKRNLLLIINFFVRLQSCNSSTFHIIPPIHKLRSFNHSNNHKNNEGPRGWQRVDSDVYVCLTDYLFLFSRAINMQLCAAAESNNIKHSFHFDTDTDAPRTEQKCINFLSFFHSFCLIIPVGSIIYETLVGWVKTIMDIK